MAAIIQGIGAATALTSANSLDTKKSLFANSRRSLSGLLQFISLLASIRNWVLLVLLKFMFFFC